MMFARIQCLRSFACVGRRNTAESLSFVRSSLPECSRRHGVLNSRVAGSKRRFLNKAVASSPESSETEVETKDIVEEAIDFLKEDLKHLFDDQGIDASRYDDVVEFEDPITAYSSIQGYLFNIAMLRRVFAPTYEMHDIKKTGENEITARWTMTMRFTWNGPIRGFWDPRLIFTGVSIYGLNPENGKINKHIDLWDSIDDQQYFSVEAFRHVLSQVLSLSSTPDLETVDYTILKKTSSYEVRRYPSFPVIETNIKDQNSGGYVNPAVDGSRAFQRLAGYIFGQNEGEEKMDMTTPVISTSSGKMQFPIGSKYEGMSSMPTPTSTDVECKDTGGGLYAVAQFDGLALEPDAEREHSKLEKAMVVDGMTPGKDWTLARYNEPFTNPATRRNEVLIPIEDGFSLW
ncbi:hypothetical protein BSKO_00247 [Bryopsis sp. KO-2023]|nr:hypothetical protein BSKO_00247 [Bryopsis sp. KO-2023]